MTNRDVVVLGGGPAALAAAAACVEVGLSVSRVDPAPEQGWANTYGVWVDELAGLGLEPTLGHRWDRVEVIGRRRHVLGRSYGVFDNAALAAALTARAGDAEVVAGRVVGANHDRWGSTAVLHDGRFLDARVLIDATGHHPVLVHRPERSAPAMQAAYGIVARCASPPYEPGSCVLMDWSCGPGDDSDPTFLYALDLGDDWWLLEETSLARRSPLSLASLEDRLHRRLAERGIVVREVRATEVVEIPMGLPLPSLGQRAVGLGGAASMVHPATGYSVGASLRVAALLATAIAQAIERRATPQGVSRAAWAAVWPSGRVRTRSLQQYGLEGLLRFDLGDLRWFFDAFFTLPTASWFGYLAGLDAANETAGTMRSLFGELPPGVRAKLVASNPIPLVRAVAGR